MIARFRQLRRFIASLGRANLQRAYGKPKQQRRYSYGREKERQRKAIVQCLSIKARNSDAKYQIRDEVHSCPLGE
jgi:hypothetical protein